MTSSINLHKFGVLPEDEGVHVFTFIFENPKRLLEQKSVESSEVIYGGHRWTLVCMRKEEKYMGVYLKWRYTDGQSAHAMSCKAKYMIALIHRLDYTENRYFNSHQKFSSSQSLLGKSKFLLLSDLLDLGAGFLDDTGKRLVLELSMSKCSTRFETAVDISPKARTKKNVSGYYFDTSTFLMSNHRWYLRLYPTKSNSNGLPAVYLYLSSKPKGIAVECVFRLYLNVDTTELLSYNYGEGAKFDGFGKTLTEPLYDLNRTTQLTVGVEMTSLNIWKDHLIKLRGSAASHSVYSPHVYRDYSSSYNSRSPSSSSYNNSNTLTQADAFQDQEGNYWKADIERDSQRFVVVFDKGVHHYQQNKTKLLCWTATLLSRDPDRASDLDMARDPVVGYFSNFIDEKGYKMPFPVDVSELEEHGSPYSSQNGEVMIRINLISLQTISVGMRSIPRFDFQARHLLRARRLLQERTRNLEDMREMTASRASLSMLDVTRDMSEAGSMSGGGRMGMFKSYESLDALSTGDAAVKDLDDDYNSKSFFTDLLQHISNTNILETNNNEVNPNTPYSSSRDDFHGTREDVDSGVTMSDETSMLLEARPSPVDINRQKDIVAVIVKFLQQRLPLRITEIVEFGSLGSNTSTKSRMDVDLILFSPDLPHEGHNSWSSSLIHATNNLLQQALANPEPFIPLPKCTYFTQTPYALQFTCSGVDVDIMFTHEWDSPEGAGYTALYDMTCRQNNVREKQWCALACAKRQKKFIVDQPNEIKEIIKVVKHWRNTIQWKKTAYRPNSYLLSLLIVKSAEIAQSHDMRAVLEQFGALVMAPELSIQWKTFYEPSKFTVEFDPPTPLVRDPGNPGFNVADTLSYWGQFRAEIIVWLRDKNIQIAQLDVSC